jgi:hypothetical protein
VLSGAGSVLGIALLEKTAPIDITKVVRIFVCGASTECVAELDIFHPGITLAQTVVDASDPVHSRVLPGVRDRPEAGWLGLADVGVGPEGLAGNLGGGAATGVLAQFSPKAGRDGHFVVFDVPEARAQSARFLRALADDPRGRFVP